MLLISMSLAEESEASFCTDFLTPSSKKRRVCVDTDYLNPLSKSRQSCTDSDSLPNPFDEKEARLYQFSILFDVRKKGEVLY